MDFPTPPLPERIRIFRLTPIIRFPISGRAGSGSFGTPDAQIDWFSQPAQASDLPASSDSVPYRGKKKSTTGLGNQREYWTHWTVFGSIGWNGFWIRNCSNHGWMINAVLANRYRFLGTYVIESHTNYILSQRIARSPCILL